MIGQIFGRWTVVSFSHKTNKPYWDVVCSCTNNTQRTVDEYSLKRGTSTSCGCLRKENFHSRTHGLSSARPYKIWEHMLDRCYNPNFKQFKDYSGRGISVCSRWLDFKLFWEDMGDSYRSWLTLDRIDTNGNYEPTNCKWSSRREQSRNRRNNIWLTTSKGTFVLTDAAIAFGLSPDTVYGRFKRGWPVERLLEPVAK